MNNKLNKRRIEITETETVSKVASTFQLTKGKKVRFIHETRTKIRLAKPGF